VHNRSNFAKQIELVFGEWRARGNMLVYCKQGANRSVAFVILLIAVLTGRTAEEVRWDCRENTAFSGYIDVT
jgi:predicted protein tyrosine phosphatase